MISILKKEELKRIILRRLIYGVGKDTDFAVTHDWYVALAYAVSAVMGRPSSLPRRMDSMAARVETWAM